MVPDHDTTIYRQMIKPMSMIDGKLHTGQLLIDMRRLRLKSEKPERKYQFLSGSF